MADIEEQIFKLSIDGSAYIAGADSVTASTNKFVSSQEKANEVINKLKQANIQLAEETKALSSEYNRNAKALRELLALQQQSSGVLAKQYEPAIKLLEQQQKKLTAAIVDNKEVLKQSTTAIKDAEKANVGFAGSLKNTYAGLGKIANLIPGLGMAGLAAIIAGPVVNAFKDWYDSVNKTNNAVELTNGVLEASGKEYSNAIGNVSRLKAEINLAKEGFLDKKKVVEDYNTSIGKTTGLVKTLEEAEIALNKNAEAYIRFTFLKAAANEANSQAAKKSVEAELAKAKHEVEFVDQSDAVVATLKNFVLNPFNTVEESIANSATNLLKTAEKAKKKVIDTANEDSKTLSDLSKKYLDEAAKLAKAFNFNFFDDTKFVKPKKGPQNIYQRELDQLRADIAKLDQKSFTDEVTITKAVEADFQKRTDAFDKAFKNKQLTAGQLTSLKGYLADLQKLTLDQNLKSFREQKAAYLNQIETELANLQIEENTKRILSIQDRFERERQTIIAETEKTANSLKDRREKQIAQITKDAAKNGLTVADVAPQIQSIKDTYGKLLDDLEIIKLQKLQQLSFDTFEKLSEDAKRLLDSGNLGVSQGSLVHIQKQTELFLSGKISYEKYQKELTEIAKFEANERFRLEKLFLEAEIRVRQDKLKTDSTLTDDQIKRLEDEIRRLQQQLTDAEKGNATSNASTGNAVANKRIDTILKYTQAIGDLASKVISFWQQVNAAESESLDRSIAIQEKRVDAAQRIAERGNAQYLKQEEDRLTELNVKRENAARKQLGVNAALQGSEILVALISGIAQGVKLGGPLGAIASVAAIVAAIAGAFSIAQSLKPPTPSFFVGTEDTGRGGKADSKGGFHAVLHPHERVLTAEENKKLKGISNRDLVETVNRFHQIKSVPLPDYSRIKESAELSINKDGRMSVLLEENNSLQRQTLKVLHKMGVNVSLDQNGFAVSQMEVIEQMKINKRV